KAYTAFADGVSPAHQVDVEGPTAVINSVSKLDHIGMSGGSICNMKFSPASVQTPEGQQKFANFIKGAVQQGFFHLQFNVNDEKMLRDAQKHPENYKELLVRVAGYSAFFIYLSERLQEDVIGRTCHAV
ncbi:MAG: glycyl radical protein, partial [Clostridiales bacterium]|nr:glycyl radical protein [Clostridiales bacterium]